HLKAIFVPADSHGMAIAHVDIAYLVSKGEGRFKSVDNIERIGERYVFHYRLSVGYGDYRRVHRGTVGLAVEWRHHGLHRVTLGENAGERHSRLTTYIAAIYFPLHLQRHFVAV